jgi:hypothetical protein
MHGHLRSMELRLMRQAAIVVLGLFFVAAGVIAARAFAGALERPLPFSALLAAGLLVVAAAALVRLGWLLPMGERRLGKADLAAMILTTICAAAFCGGLCLPPETSPTDVILVRILFVVEESGAWFWIFRKWIRKSPSSAQRSPDSPVPSDSRSALTMAAVPLIAVDAIPAEEVFQQLTRSRAADGAEELSGWLRMPFAAGQRTGSVHVAFCPPLPETPELSVEQIDGPEARVKTAQLLPYGVRLDLKLVAAAEEPASVLLQFSARTTG